MIDTINSTLGSSTSQLRRDSPNSVSTPTVFLVSYLLSHLYHLHPVVNCCRSTSLSFAISVDLMLVKTVIGKLELLCFSYPV
jgi:hypothetical protein